MNLLFIYLTKHNVPVETSIQLLNGLLNRGKIDDNEPLEIAIGTVIGGLLGFAGAILFTKDTGRDEPIFFLPFVGAFIGGGLTFVDAMSD